MSAAADPGRPAVPPAIDPSRRAILLEALLALLLCTGIAVAVPVVEVRPLLVVASAIVLPGAALLTRFDLEDPLIAAALAIALSIAIDILGSLALVWTGWWHPLALGLAIGAGVAVLLLHDLRRCLTAARGSAG